MPGTYRRLVQTVDSHTEGNSTRVITGGYAIPPGRTLLEKRAWLWRHDDGLRRMLNFEPRGHGMMCSVLLMPPCLEGADFSVIIMEQDEYVPMCGHCIIGTAMTVVATGMVEAREPITTVRIETPAGLVRCEVEVAGGKIGRVGFENVESFLLHQGARIEVEGVGTLRVDVAYGGDFYAIVDADGLGIRLAPDNDAAMIEAARRIIRAVGEQLEIRHPKRPDINRCYQTLFTSAEATTGDLKQTIVCPPGSLDRSPCGTGTSARLAELFAKGEIGPGETLRFEGVLGTCFEGSVIAAEERAGMLYIRPKVTGRAYLTGFHQFVLDPDDPLPLGFRIGHPPRPAPDLEGSGWLLGSRPVSVVPSGALLGSRTGWRKRSRTKAKCSLTRLVFEPDEQAGGYVVTCPALPGLVTEGDTLEEARDRAAGAIRCYLESLRKDGLPLPIGELHHAEPIREPVTVVLKRT